MKRFLMVIVAIALFLGAFYVLYLLSPGPGLGDKIGVGMLFGLGAVIFGICRGDFDGLISGFRLSGLRVPKFSPRLGGCEKPKDSSKRLVLAAMAATIGFLGFLNWKQGQKIDSLEKTIESRLSKVERKSADNGSEINILNLRLQLDDEETGRDFNSFEFSRVKKFCEVAASRIKKHEVDLKDRENMILLDRRRILLMEGNWLEFIRERSGAKNAKFYGPGDEEWIERYEQGKRLDK